MTPADLHDLCLVKTLHYRALLNAAYAGYPSHTAEVEANRAALEAWECIDRAGSVEALTDAQRRMVHDARLGRK